MSQVDKSVYRRLIFDEDSDFIYDDSDSESSEAITEKDSEDETIPLSSKQPVIPHFKVGSVTIRDFNPDFSDADFEPLLKANYEDLLEEDANRSKKQSFDGLKFIYNPVQLKGLVICNYCHHPKKLCCNPVEGRAYRTRHVCMEKCVNILTCPTFNLKKHPQAIKYLGINPARRRKRSYIDKDSNQEVQSNKRSKNNDSMETERGGREENKKGELEEATQEENIQPGNSTQPHMIDDMDCLSFLYCGDDEKDKVGEKILSEGDLLVKANQLFQDVKNLKDSLSELHKDVFYKHNKIKQLHQSLIV